MTRYILSRLRDLMWDPTLAGVRRQLVLGVLYISLLSALVIWAWPMIYRRLNPPEPIAVGTCTERAITIGSTALTGDLAAAKKRIGRPDLKIVNAGWVWNEQNQRLELWLITEKDVWQLEIVCFEIVTPGKAYVAQFGDFKVEKIQDMIDADQELKAIEMGK